MFSYPAFEFSGNFDKVDGLVKYNFAHPSTWSLDLTIDTIGAEVVREIVETSLAEVPAESFDMYLTPNVIVDSQLALRLANKGEYFKLSVAAQTSKISPDALLGAADASLSVVVTATENMNISSYTFALETEIDTLQIGDHLHLNGIKFKAEADLTAVFPQPNLLLSLDCDAIVTFGNESMRDLEVNGIISGEKARLLDIDVQRL